MTWHEFSLYCLLQLKGRLEANPILENSDELEFIKCSSSRFGLPELDRQKIDAAYQEFFEFCKTSKFWLYDSTTDVQIRWQIQMAYLIGDFAAAKNLTKTLIHSSDEYTGLRSESTLFETLTTDKIAQDVGNTRAVIVSVLRNEKLR